MFQTIFNLLLCVIVGVTIRRVRKLSADRKCADAKLDKLAETIRDDLAAQWQQQFRSKALEQDQQSELETIISVQAERLAAQGKQISVLREKADNVVTQTDDIQVHQQELIDSLQKQLENLRDKTEEMFRAQAAQFNHRFAFQQELRAEYDKLAKLVQILWISYIMHHQQPQCVAPAALNMFACDDITLTPHYNSLVGVFKYHSLTGYPSNTELTLNQFIETIKNLN